MNNFFLLNEAVDLDDIDLFKSGIGELASISFDKTDNCLRHDTIWQLPIFTHIYQNFGQEEQFITQFIEQLIPSDKYFRSGVELDANFPSCTNAFLGINFSGTSVEEDRQIIYAYQYALFKKALLWDFSYSDFWEKREALFPNLTLCSSVLDQIVKIGNSKYFNQIIMKLQEFDRVIGEYWVTGSFNYNLINRNSALNISPESQSTMNKYGNHRLFSIPDGRREYCELHIKTGDLRFHFYPDNSEKKIYIGYIGHHLPIVSG